MIKQLNPRYLKKLLNNECEVKLYKDGLSEEGEPLAALELDNQKCRFVEKTKIIIDTDGKKVELIGKVILEGNIAPNLKKISGGEVIIENIKYDVFQASRPRNPDGTVYMTVLELR